MAGIDTLALSAHGPPEGEGHPQAPRHQCEAARPLPLLRGGNYVAVTRSNTVPPAVPALGGNFFFLKKANIDKKICAG